MSIKYNFLRPSYMIMNNHAWESHDCMLDANIMFLLIERKNTKKDCKLAK